jgi:hypothetical protein
MKSTGAIKGCLPTLKELNIKRLSVIIIFNSFGIVAQAAIVP